MVYKLVPLFLKSIPNLDTLKHTIINMCDEAIGMVVCGKNEKAFEVLKAANIILEFEKWNRAGDFSELKEIIEKTEKGRLK